MIRLLCASSIINSLKENVSLKEIDLSWNGIDSSHSADLANVLITNNTLLELNLNNNRICQNGVANIAKGIASNESLICLRINGNPIGEDGFQAILTAIRENPRNCLETLEHPKVDFPTKATAEMIESLRSVKSDSSSTNFLLYS